MTKKKENFDFFDGCSICQAMKEGKAGTLEELKDAFQKAKERGAVVGGEMFEKID